MKFSIKSRIRRAFPCTLIIKAWLNAWKAAFSPARESYSQVGEDIILCELLRDRGIAKGHYIDVGANHPTKLSNTYRLYRQGFSGVVVEPYRAMLKMHRRFRPNDIHMAVGCGETPGVLPFHHATSHVLSGFKSEGLKAVSFRGMELIPVLPLDMIMVAVPDWEIDVLSIDVEGFDLQVVAGATETLKRTRFVVMERGESDDEVIEVLANNGFGVVRSTSHNLIFERVQ